MIHVEVRSERYPRWPGEWRERGKPWRDEHGRQWYDLVPPSPAAGQPRQRDIALLFRTFRLWGSARPDVRAVGLVGSWARGAAAGGSDVDFVVLREPDSKSTDPDILLDGLPVLSSVTARQRGVATEARWITTDGLELDACFADITWAATRPIDDGTRRVLAGRMQRIYDIDNLLLDLQSAAPAREDVS